MENKCSKTTPVIYITGMENKCSKTTPVIYITGSARGQD